MAGDPDDAAWAMAETVEDGTRLSLNVASIAAVPWEELPDGPARFCLLDMAYAGGNVGAYCAADGRWWVRVGRRSETCAEWAARFNQCDEME